ncbi:FG-GAP repeat domain-containing protein [Thiocystis violacea]|uniref:FG-GAP repeat domain-containing protein n=1 Tax=Thiocystis violacea TaxID=13725 RepID=UPI001902DE9A|nr:FG-GAP-like repeat-containing protein [Thiocystis violacea]
MVACGLSTATPASEPGSYRLEWDPVTDDRLTGYRLHYGTSPRQYDFTIDVDLGSLPEAGKQPSYTVTNLDAGEIYYFAVTAAGAGANESSYSNEITTGHFRYVFSASDIALTDTWLEVGNMNREFEQTVAVGSAALSTLPSEATRGESHIASGDIDGDGRDELVIGYTHGDGSTGSLGGLFRILDDDFSFLRWGQLSWPDYNQANGETYPAIGDLDGDGRAEIVIGLGAGGDGLIEVFSYNDNALASIGWTHVDWPEYTAALGKVFPALGDLNGDGRDELVVGLAAISGSNGLPGGSFLVKKDFILPTANTNTDSPWSEPEYPIVEIEAGENGVKGRLLTETESLTGDLTWGDYANAVGETRPALGDVDGDGKDEIVIGLGHSGGGFVEVFDYEDSALLSRGYVGVDMPEYNGMNGETRPSVGDIDNDARSEILVGLGKGSYGVLELIDDAAQNFSFLESFQAQTVGEDHAEAGFWPVVKREHRPD